MASLTKYDEIHGLLAQRSYTVQGIAEALSMSRVTVTKILKNSPDVVEHMTWPRTYALKPESKYNKREIPILSDNEKTLASKYLDYLLQPDASLDLATQFQAVDSVEGADALIKALQDCIKVAQYYKLLLKD